MASSLSLAPLLVGSAASNALAALSSFSCSATQDCEDERALAENLITACFYTHLFAAISLGFSTYSIARLSGLSAKKSCVSAALPFSAIFFAKKELQSLEGLNYWQQVALMASSLALNNLQGDQANKALKQSTALIFLSAAAILARKHEEQRKILLQRQQNLHLVQQQQYCLLGHILQSGCSPEILGMQLGYLEEQQKVFVESILESGLAKNFGFQVGDVIEAAFSYRIEDLRQFEQILASTFCGSMMPCIISRNGQKYARNIAIPSYQEMLRVEVDDHIRTYEFGCAQLEQKCAQLEQKIANLEMLLEKKERVFTKSVQSLRATIDQSSAS